MDLIGGVSYCVLEGSCAYAQGGVSCYAFEGSFALRDRGESLKPQSHKYRIMIRWIAAGIGTEGNFLWCIKGFLTFV